MGGVFFVDIDGKRVYNNQETFRFPEDAEILIEGSETGRTWAANDLEPLEWLFESTMIVIAGKRRNAKGNHRQVEKLAQRFLQAAA